MRQELKNAFGRVFLTIDVDYKNKWVFVNWMGYLTEDNIKTGSMAYTNVLSDSKLNCVLNDTRLILGGWDHSLDWVINEWAPRASRAGLKHFALISTPESFGDSTAAAFHANLRSFRAKVFNDRSPAEDWLRRFSLRQ